MKTCNLCLKNKADQKNSHIFPKFLGVSLIETTGGKRKGFRIDSKSLNKKGKIPVMQDTPKENYILCKKCEGEIGKLEYEFAREFYNDFKTSTSSPTIIKKPASKGYSYIVVPNVEYINFKSTLYSMLWRAHISSLPYFSDLNLSSNTAETLRKILNKESGFVDIPMFVITSENDPDKTKNFIYANSTNRECFLWMNEFVVFLNLNSVHDIFDFFSEIKMDKNNNTVKVGLLSLNELQSIRQTLVDIKVKKESDNT